MELGRENFARVPYNNFWREFVNSNVLVDFWFWRWSISLLQFNIDIVNFNVDTPVLTMILRQDNQKHSNAAHRLVNQVLGTR